MEDILKIAAAAVAAAVCAVVVKPAGAGGGLVLSLAAGALVLTMALGAVESVRALMDELARLRPVAGGAGSGAQDRGYCNPDPHFRRGVPGREGERHRGLRGDRGGPPWPCAWPFAAAGGVGHCDGLL